MSNLDFVIFLFFVVVVILHSFQVWIDPSAFVHRMQRVRSALNKFSFGLLLPKYVQEDFDKNPESEILFARIMFIIFYFAIIYIAIISIS
jgi:hypothetical protein